MVHQKIFEKGSPFQINFSKILLPSLNDKSSLTPTKMDVDNITQNRYLFMKSKIFFMLQKYKV